MTQFHPDWAMREELAMQIDLWIARPRSELLRKRMVAVVQRYCDDVGLCVTITSTRFVFTGGYEMGFRVGLRNYPRFVTRESSELLAHAEKIGRAMAEAGDQGSFMIEEVGSCVYWFTRRLNDGESPQTIAECGCETPGDCSRTGCRHT